MNGLLAIYASAVDVWWAWAVAMSWQIPVFAAIVWLLAGAMRKGPARLRYALWVLLFIKLIVPPQFGTPWSAESLWNRLQREPVTAQGPAPYALGGGAAATTDASTTNYPAAPAPVAGTPIAIASPAMLMSIWLAGAIVCFTVMLWNYLRYRNAALAGATAAPEMAHVADDLRALLRIRRPIDVKTSSAVATPGVMGIRRPMVLLPENGFQRLSQAERRAVIAHELAHVKRGDLVAGWFAAVATCLYWFHPVVWWASLQLKREREMACDDRVLEVTQQDGKAYAATIVRVAESFSAKTPAGVGALGLIELYDNLLHRIRSASDYGRGRRLGWSSLPVIVLALCLLPMGAAQTASALTDAAEREIDAHYADAHPEVQEFLLMASKTYGPQRLWLPEGAFDDLKRAERDEKIAYYSTLLAEGEYGRHLCDGLAAASVLQDDRLVPGLIRIAGYGGTSENIDALPRWMAIAALARTEAEAAVPVLVPFVDCEDLDTRMWARAALLRITGQPFDKDKRAWAEWWNADDAHTPKIPDEATYSWHAIQLAQANTPPAIIKTEPEVGAVDVPADTKEIRVTFDRDMGGGMSWTGGGEVYPEIADKPRWIDKRTCVLPVKLTGGKFYRVGINSTSYQNFRSAAGIPANPSAIYFVTSGATDAEKDKVNPPTVVSLNPANGATEVSPTLNEISATFDRAMGGGFSWVNSEGKAPDSTERAQWSDDMKTCTRKVTLEPGKEYVISLNSVHHKNFSSAYGVALSPVRWTFSTAEAAQ